MMKLRFTVVMTIAVGLMVACGPKSRYRAVDVTATTKTTSTTTSTTAAAAATSPTRPGLSSGVPAPENPEASDTASQRTAGEIEHVAITKALLDDGSYGIDLFVKIKTGATSNEVRLLNLKGNQQSIILEEIGKLQSDDTSDRITDGKLRIEGKCSDDKCENVAMTLINDSARVNVTAKIDSKKMRIENGDTKDIDDKFKHLIGDFPVQNNVVKVPNPNSSTPSEFYSLMIGSGDGLVFTMKKGSTENIQDLQVLYGKSLGIATARFEGTHEKFDLTLKDKDQKVLAKLKVGPVPAPVAATPPPSGTPAQSDQLIKLTCFKEMSAGVRVPETFSVKLEAKLDDKTGRTIHQRVDDSEIKTITFEANETTKVVTGIKGSGVMFSNLPGMSTRVFVEMTISDDQCKEEYETTSR